MQKHAEIRENIFVRTNEILLSSFIQQDLQKDIKPSIFKPHMTRATSHHTKYPPQISHTIFNNTFPQKSLILRASIVVILLVGGVVWCR